MEGLEYFLWGVVAALVPSFLALVVILFRGVTHDDDGDGPTRGT